MKQFLKWTGFVLFASIIGLALSVAYIASARVQSPVAVVQRAVTPATPYADTGPWSDWSAYSPSGVYTPTRPQPIYGYEPGMMGGHDWGMMGPGMHGGMMGGYGGWDYDDGVAPQGTPAPVDEEIQLTATNFRFEPATITVKAGEAVRLAIANKDSVPHNLYSPDMPIAYTLLPAGVIRSAIFTAPTAAGTYLAVCTFHPGMTLEIVVK